MFRYRILDPVWESDAGRMEVYRRIWDRKPVLRRIYADWFTRIRSWQVPGRTIEMGSGVGAFKRWDPSVMATDIQRNGGLDMQCNAESIPVQSGSMQNVICIDVVHHFANAQRFLGEAGRVLAPGGRLVMLEPYMGGLAGKLRSWFHHEKEQVDPDRPWESDLGLPTRLFTDGRSALSDTLVVRHRGLVSSFLYPLSGGYNYRSLLPEWAYRPFKAIDDSLVSITRGGLAFKLLLVLERAPQRNPEDVTS